MIRINEIIADIRERHPTDSFFSDFEHSCQTNSFKKKHYGVYNKALMALDDKSWQALKEKALRHYMNHRKGQLKEGFFNQLNEAFAYKYLASQGCKNIEFIKEGKKTSPDIQYSIDNTLAYCEVKTFCVSDAEIGRRSANEVFNGAVYVNLNEMFCAKFAKTVNKAISQISACGNKGLVYVIVNFDDFVLDYYSNYRKQLIAFSKEQGFKNLFMKIGLTGNRRICIKDK
jgi:hypothetical protein